MIAIYLREYLEVMIGSPVAGATEYPSMNKDLAGTGGNLAGNGEGDCGSVLKI